MEKKKQRILRPLIIFLIGIILVALSFTLWWFAVSPIVTHSTYGISQTAISDTIGNQTQYILYFGNVTFMQHTVYNHSRPVDISFDLSFKVDLDKYPLNLTVYVRDTRLFRAQINQTIHTIECDTAKFNNSSYRPTGTLVQPSINGTIPTSLLDAFYGGTTPYMTIDNLNATQKAKITYGYSYDAVYRSSNGVPLVLFIIGIILVVVEGVVLLRHAVRRVRER